MKYKKHDDFKVFATGISKIITRPKSVKKLSSAEITKKGKILSLDIKEEKDILALEAIRLKEYNYNYNHQLSESAKDYLISLYGKEKYGFKRASLGGVQTSTTLKGLALEQEGVDMVSKLDKIKYFKPSESISNDFIIGLPDAISMSRDKIVDIKTSWDFSSFGKNRKNNKLEYRHFAQMQAYLELYNIEYGQVCYVLCNTPQHLIDREKMLLMTKFSLGEITREKYEDKAEQYNFMFNYNRVPLSKRVIRFDVKRDRSFIDFVNRKVIMCREYLNEYEKLFMSNKIIVSSYQDYINATEEDYIEHNTTEPL